MKSSMFLVTRNVGFVTVCGPTQICPCSIYVTASFNCSAKFRCTKTVESLRLQAKNNKKSHYMKEERHIISTSIYCPIQAKTAITEFLQWKKLLVKQKPLHSIVFSQLFYAFIWAPFQVNNYSFSKAFAYLKKDDTDNRSHRAKLFLVGIMPILYLPMIWKQQMHQVFCLRYENSCI